MHCSISPCTARVLGATPTRVCNLSKSLGYQRLEFSETCPPPLCPLLPLLVRHHRKDTLLPQEYFSDEAQYCVEHYLLTHKRDRKTTAVRGPQDAEPRQTRCWQRITKCESERRKTLALVAHHRWAHAHRQSHRADVDTKERRRNFSHHSAEGFGGTAQRQQPAAVSGLRGTRLVRIAVRTQDALPTGTTSSGLTWPRQPAAAS
jgi:hypothetical protein